MTRKHYLWVCLWSASTRLSELMMGGHPPPTTYKAVSSFRTAKHSGCFCWRLHGGGWGWGGAASAGGRQGLRAQSEATVWGVSGLYPECALLGLLLQVLSDR